MRKLLSILLSGIMSGGCLFEITETDTPFFGGDPQFTVTRILAEGKSISALEVTDENNYCYSVGNKLFIIKDNLETSVDLPSDVMSIALDKPGQTLWLGTYSSGLVSLKNGKTTFYNQQNSQLPRNLVRDVLCDSRGRVWFNCSAHKLGGLGLWSDGKITVFTPENSSLPDNLIKSTAIRNDILYVATGGTVTQQKVFTGDENGWDPLPVTGYYLMDMDVDDAGTLYVIDDSGLSSSMITNKIYQVDSNGSRDILKQKNRWDETPYIVKTDRRKYLWVTRFTTQTGKRQLTLFDGENWLEAPEDFPDFYIKCMAVDNKNNLWLGTDKGIYILEQ